jgi:WSC domain
MKRLLLIALSMVGALALCSEFSQAQPPIIRKPPIAPRPLPIDPRPNGAFACFVDVPPALGYLSPLPNPAGHDLSGQVSWSPHQTNDQCRSTCGSQNFLYAGTQSGAFCFCGNTAGTHGPALPPSACNSPCMGSQGEMCGGPSANSVSLTGALSFVPPPVAPPPADGGQCVIDLSGPGYRDFEVQRWEVSGPSTMGINGPVYPMNWTVNGSGRSLQVTTAGSDTTILVRAWSMSGGGPVGYIATNNADHSVYFHENSTPGSASLTEAPQQKFIDGVLQASSATPPAGWGELQNNASFAAPVAAVLAFSTLISVDPMHPTPSAYGNPSAASGTIACTWNVVR